MSIQQELEELMLKYEGVCAIFITDQDGALIMHIGLPASGDNARFRNALILSHITTVPQIHKLTLGGHKTTFAVYESHQIAIHSLRKYYFIVHAGVNANAGAMLAMREKLIPIANQLMVLCPPIDADVQPPSIIGNSDEPDFFD